MRPSDSTIYEWFVRFTKQAIAESEKVQVKTGCIWAADETVLNVAGGQTKGSDANSAWFWDVIDEDTRFLLPSRLSRRRTVMEIEGLFMEAREWAATAPQFLVTDKLVAYVDGIERVFGVETRHIHSQGMWTETHNNVIERFHGTIKERTKVMRGLMNKDTAELFMNGWLINYKYFRPHESLNGATPGEAAQADYPFKSWEDVVKAGYIPTERREVFRVRR